jgi:metal-responsive CopG/Arc/MetJ family transcriptional regulator
MIFSIKISEELNKRIKRYMKENKIRTRNSLVVKAIEEKVTPFRIKDNVGGKKVTPFDEKSRYDYDSDDIFTTPQRR